MWSAVPHRKFTPLVRPWRVLAAALRRPEERLAAVGLFEEALGRMLGAPNVALTSSARVGLWAILRALELPPESPVWLPANSYEGLVPFVRAAGLVPRFADVGGDHNLSPETLEMALAEAPGPGVVVATHMFGHPCDVKGIVEVAESHGLMVVEDCAHALGVRVDGVACGLTGVAGFLSFQARKAINVFAGGAVVSRDDRIAAAARAAIESTHRAPPKVAAQALTYAVEQHLLFSALLYPLTRRVFANASLLRITKRLYAGLGQSHRLGAATMSPIQAMLGLEQLVAHENRHRRLASKWALYDRAVASCPGLERPPRRPDGEHGFYMYVLETLDAAAFARALWQERVGSAHGASLVPCLAEDLTRFPRLAEHRRRSVQIPFSDGLGDDAFERVAGALGRAALAAKPR